MVKPPKTMQPEGMKVADGERNTGRSFQMDSFRNYMARKIDLQRQQFGVQLPPAPVEKDVKDAETSPSNMPHSTVPARQGKKSGISTILHRLEAKHGSRAGRKRKRSPDEQSQPSQLSETEAVAAKDNEPRNASAIDIEGDMVGCTTEKSPSMPSQLPQQAVASSLELRRQRPDLFLLGVTVLVNGYTNPDAATLQRLLQAHGGDLEKYETTRITHIIAEHLSFAKAKIYKQQRRPVPVVHPLWIVDCVHQRKLLPHGPYLIEEVRDAQTLPSVAKFFAASDNEAGSAKSQSELPELVCKARVENWKKASVRFDIDEANNLSVASKPVAMQAEPNLEWKDIAQKTEPPTTSSVHGTDNQYIDGRIRTTGTDPNFLETFFASSRLSFIGSYRSRIRHDTSPSKHVQEDTKQAIRQRFVMHVDMDCFFASVALRNYPQYRGKPVAISHHGKMSATKLDHAEVYIAKKSTSECATCNYEARKKGVTKGMFLGRARELCPELIVLQYDFEGYEEVADHVFNVLNRCAALHDGRVEQVSCDEAYMELSVEGTLSAALSTVATVADNIRQEIFEATQCTATVGVATNRFLSKLAGDHVKPNASFVLTGDAKELLRNLRLKDLHGVGYRMARKLESEGLHTVQNVWDFGQHAEAELCRVLGPGLGKKIVAFCHGEDDRPVQPADRKTIGAECNYGVRFDGPYGVDYMISGLVTEVAKRMEQAGVRGRRLTLKVKQRKANAPPPPKFLGHGSCHNLSRSVDTPGTLATRDAIVFARLGIELFAQMNVNKDDVRGMGIVVSKLDLDGVDGQQSRQSGLFNWLSTASVEIGDHNVETPPVVDEDMVVNQDEIPLLDTGDGESTTYLEDDGQAENGNDDGALLLPSHSQICMSQVDALPSPIRHEIMASINLSRNQAAPSQHKCIRAQRGPKKEPAKVGDLDRLFQLAAVKSAGARLDESFTMAQLDRLPLEVQLDVVEASRKRLTEEPTVIELADSGNDIGYGTELKKTLDNRSYDASDDVAFFSENIAPLSAFLDENIADYEAVLPQTIDFFNALVDEDRLPDIMVLLRSIRSRSDLWRDTALRRICMAVNEHMHERHGFRLDYATVFSVHELKV